MHLSNLRGNHEGASETRNDPHNEPKTRSPASLRSAASDTGGSVSKSLNPVLSSRSICVMAERSEVELWPASREAERTDGARGFVTRAGKTRLG
jgi:hypothetical protein